MWLHGIRVLVRPLAQFSVRQPGSRRLLYKKRVSPEKPFLIQPNSQSFRLMSYECVICVSLLRAKEETLRLAKLDRSSREEIANGSSGSISVATTKPRSPTTTTEPSAAQCGSAKIFDKEVARTRHRLGRSEDHTQRVSRDR